MIREMVLYYAPQPLPYVSKLKGVLVRMGVRIKNISPDQTGQKVGHLAGMPGFEAESETGEILPIKEEMLVMKNFTSRRVDDLLANLRNAGVPRIALKAVITEQNSQWTFYELYGELRKEHAAMTENHTKQKDEA